MDVVYIVRTGDDNEELRYSLRSLANLPHNRVWIVGHKPAWVTGVGHLPTNQAGSRFYNSTLNLRTACESGQVSDKFIYMNDDFFVMRPLDEVPTLHRGLVADVFAATPVDSPYRRGIRATSRLLAKLGHDEPLSYELHVPMVIHRQRMLETLEIGRQVHGVLHKRTLYGNYWGVGGEQVADVKVTNHQQTFSPDTRFLSTTDESFRVCAVGDYIRGMFSAPGPYEVR